DPLADDDRRADQVRRADLDVRADVHAPAELIARHVTGDEPEVVPLDLAGDPGDLQVPPVPRHAEARGDVGVGESRADVRQLDAVGEISGVTGSARPLE